MNSVSFDIIKIFFFLIFRSLLSSSYRSWRRVTVLKHFVQSKSAQSIKIRLVSSFIGLDFASPGDGQASELTSHDLVLGGRDKKKKMLDLLEVLTLPF